MRPVGRSTLLLSRFAGASLVCVGYVLAVYFLAVSVVGLTGHFWPDVIVWPGVELAGGVVIVTAVSCLGSVLLSSTANGIMVFMLFGGGLVAGLLGSIGHALSAPTRSSTPRRSPHGRCRSRRSTRMAFACSPRIRAG